MSIHEYRTDQLIEVLILIVQVKPNPQGAEEYERVFRTVYVRADSFPFKPLTVRELEVLWLAAEGMQNKEIQRALGIKQSTAEKHLSSAFGKLGVSNRTQAANLARKLGLLRYRYFN